MGDASSWEGRGGGEEEVLSPQIVPVLSTTSELPHHLCLDHSFKNEQQDRKLLLWKFPNLHIKPSWTHLPALAVISFTIYFICPLPCRGFGEEVGVVSHFKAHSRHYVNFFSHTSACITKKDIFSYSHNAMITPNKIANHSFLSSISQPILKLPSSLRKTTAAVRNPRHTHAF